MEVLLQGLQFMSLRFVKKQHNVSVLICHLLRDVASNSQYIALNDAMINE
jgi:hypothetical protein